MHSEKRHVIQCTSVSMANEPKPMKHKTQDNNICSSMAATRTHTQNRRWTAYSTRILVQQERKQRMRHTWLHNALQSSRIMAQSTRSVQHKTMCSLSLATGTLTEQAADCTFCTYLGSKRKQQTKHFATQCVPKVMGNKPMHMKHQR